MIKKTAEGTPRSEKPKRKKRPRENEGVSEVCNTSIFFQLFNRKFPYNNKPDLFYT